MAKPEYPLELQFMRRWQLRRPGLYRHLERQYVDAFFERGALRLSSFARFSEHPDEQRRDGSEGRGVLSHVNQEGEGQTIIVAMSQGLNAYVLCTSLFYSASTAQRFKLDSGFRIDDITQFANAISSHIPGFAGGIEGPCLYLAQPVLRRDMGRLGAGGESINVPGDLGNQDLYFMKSNQYIADSEYRLLWFTSGAARPFIDIECKEARSYCTRFEDMTSEREAMG